jgi:hypothetical protein
MVVVLGFIQQAGAEIVPSTPMIRDAPSSPWLEISKSHGLEVVATTRRRFTFLAFNQVRKYEYSYSDQLCGVIN